MAECVVTYDRPPAEGVIIVTGSLAGPEPLALATATDTVYSVSTIRPSTSPL